jgi:DNA/RNA endonuclease YhcR with UshA esterase domain
VSLLRKFRDWRWLFGALAVLSAVAFLGRRFLLPEGGGAVTPGTGPTLRPDEAAARVGETATVCGRVADAVYLARVNGRPTFLNFGAPDPNQEFTAVIWGEARDRFEAPPERAYRGARICVAGRIREHEGVPQIEVRGPSQLRAGRPDPGS